MIGRWWGELPQKFPPVTLDEFVVMPNHLHGILTIGITSVSSPQKSSPKLGDVVDWFKTMTTNEYIRCVKMSGWRGFPGRLWQRGYYDHVIRDGADLERIRQYIVNNPAKWTDDTENPAAVRA